MHNITVYVSTLPGTCSVQVRYVCVQSTVLVEYTNSRDYTKCVVECPDDIGNGDCDDVPPYNTEACGFDGGDCVLYNEKYPDCDASYYAYYIGDGKCHDEPPYNTEACGFDGGDCDRNPVDGYPNCFVHNTTWIDNGYCNNFPPYNTAECGFDGGDCV